MINGANNTLDVDREDMTEFDGVSQSMTPNLPRMQTDKYPGSVKAPHAKSTFLGPPMTNASVEESKDESESIFER
jgi:hypothetical protein